MPNVNAPPSQRKYLLSPDEVLLGNKIELKFEARYYTTCPRCSHLRSKNHQQIKCLGVTRPDDERVYWGCNHCGWTGPGRGDGTLQKPSPRPRTAQGTPYHAPSVKTLYIYLAYLRKVKVTHNGQKRMWWEYRAGRHDWRPGTRGINTEALLYRIGTAKILASFSHLPICIVEGEKDTDCLFNLGIPATCNAHGAAAPGQAPKWLRMHSLQLEGFDICVFNDADPPGLAHAEAVVALSRGLARSIRRIDHALHFPGTKDIADWVKYGGSRQDLLDFIEGAPCP